MDQALGVVAILAFVLAFALARRRRKKASPPSQARPATAEPVETTTAETASVDAAPAEPAVESEFASADETADAPVTEAARETLAAELVRRGRALDPLAENSAHPWELSGWPQFQAVVAVFDRPEVPLETLRQYACGGNWPLACAAFAALKSRPDKGTLLQGILPQIGKLRPWTLYFVLSYVASLEARPALGTILVMAPAWWAENLIIPSLFRDHFAEREKLGDQPDFGGSLQSRLLGDPDAVDALLLKIDHPFAAKLLEQLRRWQRTRLNTAFLGSFGRFWSEDEEEGELLSEPLSWRKALEEGEAAILQDPPRSIMAIGEARVGKTAFLQLLARRLRSEGWRVFEASAAEVMADQIYIGQIEGRVRELVAELDTRKRVAWYVMDLLQLAESGTHRGQSASILDQILPAVAAGRLVILGEMTPAGLSRLLQLRPSARSLLEVCRMHPMAEEEAATLAAAVLERIAERDKLEVDPAVLPASLHLAQQYLGSGQLPGSLIELLKRSARLAFADGATELTTDSLLSTLAQITGLPQSILDDKQRIDLHAARRFFAARVMGQQEAVGAVVDRIAMLKAGLVDPGRPVAVFLFAGPTGTGKTELAKTLAEFLFGSAERMARLDMSEFQLSDSTAKILGRPSHSDTDSLAERIRKEPFSVVLLDEFEKAHSNVWDLFLQIFDDGRLSDANGLTVDFRHCFIILTSNLGATSHRGAGIGFIPDTGAYSQDQVLRAVGQTFRPEFVNRLDRIIVFRPLSRDMMRNILLKELNDVLARRGLRRREWAVEWEASAIEFLLDRGFSPEMGARPLKRAIDQHLLAPLAVTLVEHRFPEGDQFLFVRSNGKAIEVEFVDPDADTAPAPDPAPDAAVEARISLPAMILRPRGVAQERTALAAAWAEIQAQFAGAEWTALKERLHGETSDPAIWSRPDRYAVFARLALIDRVEQAARTAERLNVRLQAKGSGAGEAPRELVARLAQQLHLVREGMSDARLDSPIDVLLSVEPALESPAEDSRQAATWSGQILEMYRRWAERRRMQVEEFLPRRGQGPVILQIAGFGAFRTLEAEAGLHLLEDGDGDSGRRTVARLRTAPGLLEEPRAAEAYQVFARRLAETGDPSTVVRRYRKGPAPLVRDVRGGWRSGRIELVLGGDFDLVGALQQ